MTLAVLQAPEQGTPLFSPFPSAWTLSESGEVRIREPTDLIQRYLEKKEVVTRARASLIEAQTAKNQFEEQLVTIFLGAMEEPEGRSLPLVPEVALVSDLVCQARRAAMCRALSRAMECPVHELVIVQNEQSPKYLLVDEQGRSREIPISSIRMGPNLGASQVCEHSDLVIATFLNQKLFVISSDGRSYHLLGDDRTASCLETFRGHQGDIMLTPEENTQVGRLFDRLSRCLARIELIKGPVQAATEKLEEYQRRSAIQDWERFSRGYEAAQNLVKSGAVAYLEKRYINGSPRPNYALQIRLPDDTQSLIIEREHLEGQPIRYWVLTSPNQNTPLERVPYRAILPRSIHPSFEVPGRTFFTEQGTAIFPPLEDQIRLIFSLAERELLRPRKEHIAEYASTVLAALSTPAKDKLADSRPDWGGEYLASRSPREVETVLVPGDDCESRAYHFKNYSLVESPHHATLVFSTQGFKLLSRCPRKDLFKPNGKPRKGFIGKIIHPPVTDPKESSRWNGWRRRAYRYTLYDQTSEARLKRSKSPGASGVLQPAPKIAQTDASGT